MQGAQGVFCGRVDQGGRHFDKGHRVCGLWRWDVARGWTEDEQAGRDEEHGVQGAQAVFRGSVDEGCWFVDEGYGMRVLFLRPLSQHRSDCEDS